MRGGDAGVAVDELAVSSDQVFVEVPARGTATGFDQFGKQRVGLFTADNGFGKHGELHAVGVVAKVGNFFGLAGLLLAKVIRRKTQHNQTLRRVVGVKFLQAFVLGREAAVTGRVDHQQHLARVLAEVLRRVVLKAGKGFVQQRRAASRAFAGTG